MSPFIQEEWQSTLNRMWHCDDWHKFVAARGMRGISSPYQNVGGCIPHPPAVDARDARQAGTCIGFCYTYRYTIERVRYRGLQIKGRSDILYFFCIHDCRTCCRPCRVKIYILHWCIFANTTFAAVTKTLHSSYGFATVTRFALVVVALLSVDYKFA